MAEGCSIYIPDLVKIDAHHHLWRYDPISYPWIDESMGGIAKDFMPADLSPILNHHAFDGTVVVQARQSLEETQFLLDLASENQFIKGVVGWVDLLADDLEGRLVDFMKIDLLKGFRHIAQTEEDDFLVSRRFLNGISKLSGSCFTYDILIFPHQLPAAIRLVRMFPGQSFVLDHLAKPNITLDVKRQWKEDIEELAKNGNVYCKISGLVTEANWDNWQQSDFKPYLDTAVGAFGTNRLMYGSDYPVCLLAASYAKVVDLVEDYFLAFEESEREKIFGGNACRFYNLDCN